MAVLAVERTATGHAIVELRRGDRLAPRILARGALVRAALVPTQAGPLAGDHDCVRILVGPGATLVVEPVAATLALPGCKRTVLRLDATVREGGRLVLDEGPLIVAAGADVRRRCTVELEDGAVAALRETVVLGRDEEPAGTLDTETRVTLAGRPLLHDGQRMSSASAVSDAHVALAPGHRVVSTLSLLGMRAEQDPGVLSLEGPGAMLRVSGASLAEVDSAIDECWRAWSFLRVRPRS